MIIKKTDINSIFPIIIKIIKLNFEVVSKFEKSFKLSILTITNTTNSQMFGIENMDFANLLTTSKLSLIIFMIIGKIELISVFLIIKKIFFKD